MSDDCLFCRIAQGEQDADIVAEGSDWLAFRDINPQAPTHILVIPREHVGSLDDLDRGQARLAGELLRAASQVADREGLDDGYRVVTNTGARAGQSVFHLHLHVMGGRAFRWPPG